MDKIYYQYPDYLMRKYNSLTGDLSNNLNVYQIISYENFFVIKQISDQEFTNHDSILKIEKESYKAIEISLNSTQYKQLQIETNNQKIQYKFKFSCLIGIIFVYDKPYIMTVDQVRLNCIMEGNKIYEVNQISLHSFKTDQKDQETDIINQIKNIKIIFSQGFYFSFTYDLANSKQKQDLKLQTDQFIFNYFVFEDLQQMNIDIKWRVPLINGHIGSFSCQFAYQRLDYFLISRRSRINGGFRFNTQELSFDGYSSNFIETEQIIYFQKVCNSFIQIRGNCPVFWEQKYEQDEIKITNYYDLTQCVIKKQFNMLIDQYNRILCINLLSKQKRYEQRLIQQYELQIKNLQNPNIRYMHCDFGQGSKGQQQQVVNEMVSNLKSILKSFGYYNFDVLHNKQTNYQSGTLRINCLDCCEKTNIVMCKIAASNFQIFLQENQFGLDQQVLKTNFFELLDTSYYLHDPNSFINKFKQIWNDHNEFLSFFYQGQFKNQSQFYELKKNYVIKQKIDYYLENVQKQKSLEFLIHPSGNQYYKKIKKYIESQQSLYTKYQDLTVFVSTWNLNGSGLKQDSNLLDNLLNFEKKDLPNIIVIGFQELVQLNAKNVVLEDNEKQVQYWKQIIQQNLNKSYYQTYSLLKTQDLVGVFLLIFIQRHLINRINFLYSDVIRTGLLEGYLGNKGACRIQLKIDETVFMFYCCHLEAGAKQNSIRIKQIKEIFQTQIQSRNQNTIDYSILLGDLNFRVNLSYFECLQTINLYNKYYKNNDKENCQKLLKQLQENDQLLQTMKSDPFIKCFIEKEIEFLPTYKFDIGTEIYDTSKKARTPSWTDRILLLLNDKQQVWKQEFYMSRNHLESDHRPVTTYYTFQIKQYDQIMMKQVKQQGYQNYLQGNIKEIRIENQSNIDYDQNIQQILNQIEIQNNQTEKQKATQVNNIQSNTFN